MAPRFNPALFARPTAGDGFALIHRCRPLRREARCACAQPIGNADYVKMQGEFAQTGNLRWMVGDKIEVLGNRANDFLSLLRPALLRCVNFYHQRCRYRYQ
jgi:hypothetical protein